MAAVVLVCGFVPARAWGGKTSLVRKYRPGQKVVYQTSIATRVNVQSNPEGLKALLPPLPTELKTRQLNTVTIRAVQADGSAEVENRFDGFEVESNLAEVMPEEMKTSAEAAQEEFSKRVSGQGLIARYDRQGKLLGFEGEGPLLEELDAPLRQMAREVLRMFLEQMGGHALYPGRRVKQGEEWKVKLDAAPTVESPYALTGESTFRFAGKTRYQGAKAAIIDFHFSNLLRPTPESLRQAGPAAMLEAEGMKLDIFVEGQGQGQALVALDDGRVLQNRTTLQQTLKARLDGASGLRLPVNGPVTLDVHSETRMEVNATDLRRR
ncbi:MAG: hypothetical protein ACE145_06035 [Terriglobia bacterium]